MGATQNYQFTTPEQTDTINIPNSITVPVEQIDSAIKTVDDKADAASTAATEAKEAADAGTTDITTLKEQMAGTTDSGLKTLIDAKPDAYTAGRDIDITDSTITLALNATNGAGNGSIIENIGTTTGNNPQENTSTANGIFSHVEGWNNVASGNYSHAEGYGDTVIVSALYGHAEGNRNTVGTSDEGLAAHAEGSNNKVYGDNSHVEGTGNTIDYEAHASHAEGNNNTINSNTSFSHAEGSGNTIRGGLQHGCSHVEGANNVAGDYAAHAEGYHTTAIGQASHAEGYYTTARGLNSHAEGQYCYANHLNQHVFGYGAISETYNDDNPATSRGKYIEIAGNGTPRSASDDRVDAASNARTLGWDGNEWVQNDVRCGGTDVDNAAYSLSTIGAAMATVPATEYGYTNELTVPTGGSIEATITFGSEKAEAPNMQCSVQDKGETMHKLTCCIGAVTTTTATFTVWNDSDTDTTAVVDWMAISGR